MRGINMTTRIDSLAALPATRRARAEYLLAELDREGTAKVSYELLDQRLVRHHRLDDGRWTGGQLDKAIDDLAAAGLLEVTPGTIGGNLWLRRLGVGVGAGSA
jgi:hypothetical protein